jgi:hypothetical protein
MPGERTTAVITRNRLGGLIHEAARQGWYL